MPKTEKGFKPLPKRFAKVISELEKILQEVSKLGTVLPKHKAEKMLKNVNLKTSNSKLDKTHARNSSISTSKRREIE